MFDVAKVLNASILLNVFMKVGPSFSDYVYSQKGSHSFHASMGDEGSRVFRGWILLAVLFFGSLLLVGRLFWMQIVQGDHYRNLSDSNRIRQTIIHAPRGVIFDRNGKPLVYNVPGFRRVVNGKTQLLDANDAIDLLAKGENLDVDSLRNYPYKDSLAHVVGYIGQVSAEDLQKPQFANYTAQDIMGKMGLEQSYESVLKGLDGQELYEVDATGKKLRTLGQTDPIPGQNITVTIDAQLQQAVYDAMKDVKKGAAIVTTPNGEVLSMVSKPSFDPNLFTMGQHYKVDSTDTYQNVSQVLLDGTGQPLLNRAIAGVYPPGSTFKLVTAGAALQDKIIDSNYTVEDDGILKVGNFSFANWYYTQDGKTEGLVDVVKAIKRSNDIFFYKVGQMVGVDRLSAFAHLLGVGSATGIDLRGEADGLLPTKEWKEKTIGEQWYLGDDYHYGIGQRYLLTTPLQVNLWTQSVANGGKEYIPHLLKSLAPVVKVDNVFTSENATLIRQGMVGACDTGGVAWPLFGYSVKRQALSIKVDGKNFVEDPKDPNSVRVVVACKTGTAQQGSDTDLPHAWLTLFAPAYNPQIVVTVLSEASGEGSNVAGPIAKQILDAYFSKK